jgi:transcriptional regulator with XRE-family HTH domain
VALMDQGMRFAEIGQQLRAYRMESGLRAEEIAARLGVSRAALYRYEKGEVIKLDTVKRLAELLKVSPLSLLGIGVEYYSRSIGYFERARQIEEGSDQILQACGPYCYLTTSEVFDTALADSLAQAVPANPADAASLRISIDQTLTLLGARKRAYQQRRPSIIAMLAPNAVRAFLEEGILAGTKLPAALHTRNRLVAAAEMERIADLMETEPMGLQFGLMSSAAPSSGFVIFRSRDRATLAVNPFRADSMPAAHTGVAMITGADEAVAAHQRVAEAMWRDAVRGPAAAAAVRALIATHGPAAA